jgi:hypothetical protein
MEDRLDALCAAAADRLGDARRTVALAAVESRSYEVGYVRDDVAAAYPPERRTDILREVVFETLGRDHQRDLFPTLGDHHATVRAFEDGSVVVYWTDETIGFLTVDAGTAHVAAALDACEEALA